MCARTLLLPQSSPKCPVRQSPMTARPVPGAANCGMMRMIRRRSSATLPIAGKSSRSRRLLQFRDRFNFSCPWLRFHHLRRRRSRKAMPAHRTVPARPFRTRGAIAITEKVKHQSRIEAKGPVRASEKRTGPDHSRGSLSLTTSGSLGLTKNPREYRFPTRRSGRCIDGLSPVSSGRGGLHDAGVRSTGSRVTRA